MRIAAQIGLDSIEQRSELLLIAAIGYNAQAAVNAHARIIVAHTLGNIENGRVATPPPRRPISNRHRADRIAVKP